MACINCVKSLKLLTKRIYFKNKIKMLCLTLNNRGINDDMFISFMSTNDPKFNAMGKLDISGIVVIAICFR